MLFFSITFLSFFSIITVVPFPGSEITSTLFINISININPIPDLSNSGFVVNKGSLAFSIFVIPTPKSFISMVIKLLTVYVSCFSY